MTTIEEFLDRSEAWLDRAKQEVHKLTGSRYITAMDASIAPSTNEITYTITVVYPERRRPYGAQRTTVTLSTSNGEFYIIRDMATRLV